MTRGRDRSCGAHIMDNQIRPNQCTYYKREHEKKASPKLGGQRTPLLAKGSQEPEADLLLMGKYDSE